MPNSDDSTASLTHIDEAGAARMVDVGGKDVTEREARAAGAVSMRPQTARLVLDNQIAKGDVLSAARIGGILAAKKTADLIPLCHGLPLEHVSVEFEIDAREGKIVINSIARVQGRTGVEMEALTAVSVAALTIYDMCKAVDRDMVIGDIRLLFKSGGKSGTYRRHNSGDGVVEK